MDADRRPPAKYTSAADGILRDPAAAANAASEAAEKAERNRGAIGRAWNDLTTMIRMVRAYAAGSYRKVPWRSIAMILGAVLYFVSPLDAIPDFLPGVGFVDDVGVLVWVATTLRTDLDDFLEWERGRR